MMCCFLFFFLNLEMSFSKLFSGAGHASLYKTFRPTYSDNIFQFIVKSLNEVYCITYFLPLFNNWVLD